MSEANATIDHAQVLADALKLVAQEKEARAIRVNDSIQALLKENHCTLVVTTNVNGATLLVESILKLPIDIGLRAEDLGNS